MAPRHESRVRVAMTAIVVTVGILLGGVVGRALQPEPWSPLGDYPTQSIEVRQSPGEIPRFELGEDATIPVKGTKCNDTNTPVTVVGTLSWVSIDPRGSVFLIAEGTGERLPGCTTTRFENQIPPEVIARQRELGLAEMVWAIQGTETPVRDGEEGVVVPWTTENFVLVMEVE